MSGASTGISKKEEVNKYALWEKTFKKKEEIDQKEEKKVNRRLLRIRNQMSADKSAVISVLERREKNG